MPAFQNQTPFVATQPHGCATQCHHNHHHFPLTLHGKKSQSGTTVLRPSLFQKLSQRKGLSSAFKAASTPSLLPPALKEGDASGTALLPGHWLGSSSTYTPWALPQPPGLLCRWMALVTWHSQALHPARVHRTAGRPRQGTTGCPALRPPGALCRRSATAASADCRISAFRAFIKKQ